MASNSSNIIKYPHLARVEAPPGQTRSHLVETHLRASPAALLRLSAQVHLDALTGDPFEYFKAVLYRLRGYQLRARGRMAALTARSPHAYDLWIARDEPSIWDRFRLQAPAGQVAIVPIIDCRAGSEGLEKTLASLGPTDAGRAIILDGETSQTTVTVAPARFEDSGEIWICPVQAGDQLAPAALSVYSSAIAAAPDAKIIYGDDDLVDAQGARFQPHLKPQWNPDLFLHHDYLSGSAVLRVTAGQARALNASGAVREWIHGLLATGTRPIHVPLILHHRRWRPKPVVPAAPLQNRTGSGAAISVIVPTRNKASLLSKCMEGLQRTAHRNFETIIIDNGSDEAETLGYLKQLEAGDVTVLRSPGPFNYSALNNQAVEHCKGEILCFLNNDIEMIDSDWLSLLVAHALRPDIGAVGPRLLYPDGTVQHAGVVTGIGGGAAHAHRLLPLDAEGYFDRARLPQRVSAVTAACLVLERHKFLAVGGFDDRNFPVAFNDVDLCLKLNSKGWQSFYEPRSTLIHHESKSRGRDTTKASKARFAGELAALKGRWHTDEARDPFHHPHLSRYTEQFLLSI